MWLGFVVVALTIAAICSTPFFSARVDMLSSIARSHVLSISNGQVFYQTLEFITMPGARPWSPRVNGAWTKPGARTPQLWRPQFVWDSGNLVIRVPLWGFLLLGGAMAGAGVWVRRRARADGRCERCGYDLAGLAIASCPECGAAGSSGR